VTAPVFLAELAGATVGASVRLTGPEGRHAAAVRRLTAGERVDLTDGLGALAECVVTGGGRDELTLEVRARVEQPRPEPWLTVVQALPKGDRGELAVDMLTEVGVDRIVPWQAVRCVTEWRGERGERALDKWRAHAREAGKQSRRPWFPEVAEAATSRQVAHRLGRSELALVLHEDAGEPLAGVAIPAGGEVVLVVGPEGGITDDELATFAAAGAAAVRLGPSVLRTSTAGVAAAAVVLARCGRWG
jgi:16S rRNA (uracil1498-N3)-methyltransferase